MQEKNITHPTDSKLYHKATVKLGEAAKQRGVKRRQTYVRVAKHAAIKVGRYAHAKQFKRMRQKLKNLRTWLGRMFRDVRRKVPQSDAALTELLQLCDRLPVEPPPHSPPKPPHPRLHRLTHPGIPSDGTFFRDAK